jgi:hypothetical protein
MAEGAAQDQERAIEAGRRRIARGERPTYHLRLAVSLDGSADVRIAELPLVHLFAPDDDRVMDAARVLVARTLDVDPTAIEVAIEPAPEPGSTA